MVDVDLEKAAAELGQFRAGFPDELFERLAAVDIGLPNQQVLDIGTSTGAIARGFARRGCAVVGLDPSGALLEEAKRISQRHDHQIEYVIGTAERSGLDTNSFDVVSAGQCWHWVDRPAALREVKRVLRPGGHVVFAQFDWIPLPGNAVEATEQLIESYNPEWKLGGGTGHHPEWLGEVRSGGFHDIETFSFDVEVTYAHRAWRGRVRASAGVRASLSGGKLTRFDETLRRTLTESFPAEPIRLLHCCWALRCRAPE
jgi:SAM-dependent methyltransferase